MATKPLYLYSNNKKRRAKEASIFVQTPLNPNPAFPKPDETLKPSQVFSIICFKAGNYV